MRSTEGREVLYKRSQVALFCFEANLKLKVRRAD